MHARWILAVGLPTDRRLVPDVVVAAAVFVLAAAVVVAEVPWVLAVDDTIVDATNDVVSESEVAVRVLHFLTDLGGAEAAWLLIALMVVWLLIRRLPRAAAYAAATGIGLAVLDPGIKALVGRLRPIVESPVATAPGPSFPSGHALAVTVTYGLLLLVVLPAIPVRYRRAVVAAVVALIAVVGLTRVALGVHHLTDVFGGWALGIVWLGVSNVAFLRPGHPNLRSDRGARATAKEQLQPAPAHDDPLPEGARSVAALVVAAVLLWGVLVGIGELISSPRGVVLDFDAIVMDWVVSIRSGMLSALAAVAGRFGGTVGIVVGLVVAVVVALAVTRRWRPALFLVVAVAGETLIFLATAAVVDRGRPEVDVLTASLPPTPSFPSGHVAAATALYGAIALVVHAWGPRWAGRLAFGAAVLLVSGVALARLYLGVHYPTDVIASMLYAAVWLAVCWRVLRPHPPGMQPRDLTHRESRGS